MKLFTPEINWHNRDPIYSVDISILNEKYLRIATSGAENSVRIWALLFNESENIKIQYRSSLDRHSMSVNVVRFSPTGNILATSGDDGLVITWKLITESIDTSETLNLENTKNLEAWNVVKIIHAHREDVYDIAWSPDSRYILTASVDNTSCLLDVDKGCFLYNFRDAKHYVQGACWDPLNEYLVTISSDSTCRIYNSVTKKLNCLLRKCEVFIGENNSIRKLYRDESLSSFFRRCSFSPDGQLLVTPSGISVMNEQEIDSATFVFLRGCWNRPHYELPTGGKDSILVRFCPNYFTLTGSSPHKMLDFEYRMIFAVATLDSVIIYDTEHLDPIGFISNIHYAVLTDLSWSHDGLFLIISSADGFISIASFSCSSSQLIFHVKQTVSQCIDENIDLKIITPEIIKKTKKRRANLISASQYIEPTPPLNGSIASVPANLEDLDETPIEKQPRRVNFITLSQQ